MRLKLFGAAATLALLIAPVHAQSVPKYGDVDKTKSPGEIEQDRAAERAYRNSLGNVPDKAPADPWGIARSPGESRTALPSASKAEPRKPRAKTGEAANKIGATAK